MHAFRQSVFRHQAAVIWLVALALFMKMLVPAGFMFATVEGWPSIMLCDGVVADMASAAPMAAMAHHPPKQDGSHKTEKPCAFAGLTAPTLAVADPVLLAAAMLFVVATVFRVADRARLPNEPSSLRPPPRGPPALS